MQDEHNDCVSLFAHGVPLHEGQGLGQNRERFRFPAIDRGEPLLSASAAAKSAVLNIMQILSREGMSHGITVNAILPSIINTPVN